MKKLLILLCPILLILSMSSTAFSTAYEFTEIIDLNDAVINSVIDSASNPGKEIKYISDDPIIGPVAFYIDDTIKFNISFADGQSIRIEDFSQPFLGNNEGLFCTLALFTSATSRGRDTHFIHNFTSYSGDLLVNPAITDYINSSPPWNWMEEDLTNSSFMFDSFSYELSFSNPVLDPKLPIAESWTGMGIYFELAADDIDISIVPEPTTMLLLGAGLIGLAGFRRKFRKS